MIEANGEIFLNLSLEKSCRINLVLLLRMRCHAQLSLGQPDRLFPTNLEYVCESVHQGVGQSSWWDWEKDRKRQIQRGREESLAEIDWLRSGLCVCVTFPDTYLQQLFIDGKRVVCWWLGVFCDRCSAPWLKQQIGSSSLCVPLAVEPSATLYPSDRSSAVIVIIIILLFWPLWW